MHFTGNSRRHRRLRPNFGSPVTLFTDHAPPFRFYLDNTYLLILHRRYGANIADHIRQPVPPGYTATEYQRLAKQYLRAVCRVYLVDYICLNYTLPADCQSLTQEAQDSIREFQRISVEQIQYTERSLFDNMRGVLPQAYMRIVAAFACLTTESPECESSIVHGDSILDVVERHDEL